MKLMIFRRMQRIEETIERIEKKLERAEEKLEDKISQEVKSIAAEFLKLENGTRSKMILLLEKQETLHKGYMALIKLLEETELDDNGGEEFELN